MSKAIDDARRYGLITSLGAFAIMALISVYGLMSIPADAIIARHWGLDGQPDGFSPRNHVLIGLPMLALILSVIFAIIPVIDPRRKNIDQSRGLYLASWIGTLSVLVLAHGFVIWAAVTGGNLSFAIIGYAVAALLIVLGNFIAKSRSNWFLGVRTPWSLSSEHAWVAANRTAGWLMVLTGLAAAATIALLGEQKGVIVLIAGAVTSALAGVVVSFFAWRNDPDRHGAAGDM